MGNFSRKLKRTAEKASLTQQERKKLKGICKKAKREGKTRAEYIKEHLKEGAKA